MSLVGSAVGPYRILSEIRAGGMGSVYLAQAVLGAGESREGMRVALKLLHPHLADSPEIVQRFLREARAGLSVRHPNVVRTLDAGTAEVRGRQEPFIAMEFVEGSDLAALRDEIGRFPEGLCRQVGAEVAQGLAAIHAAGIVHRDLKPDNVLFTKEQQIKITDFGVAHLAKDVVRLSRAGEFLGSFLYAAPEQFHSETTEIDGRADLYALGWILHLLACGIHPLEGNTPVSVIRAQREQEPPDLAVMNPGVSPFFAAVVRRLLQKDPGGRFPSAAELAATLRLGEESPWWAEHREAARPRREARLRPPRTTAPTELRGRETELAALLDLAAGAGSGEGRVVLLEGETGLGKTRLAMELVAALEARARAPRVLWGAFPPGGAAGSHALHCAFREAIGDGGPAAFLEGAGAPPLPPHLAAALEHHLPSPPALSDAPSVDPDLLHEALAQAVRALARAGPLVLVVEDLHFAPDRGRRLFASLAPGEGDGGLLLLGTTAPGLPPGWAEDLHSAGRCTRMEVPPLSPGAVEAVIADFLHSPALAATLREPLVEMSGGSPLFVLEVLREMLHSGRLAARPDGTLVLADARTIEIPAGIRAMFEARIGRVAGGDREVLELAACRGFQFSPLDIAAASGQNSIAVLQSLGRIERDHRLVRCRGEVYSFEHHLVRELVLSRMAGLLVRELRAAFPPGTTVIAPPQASAPPPGAPAAARPGPRVLVVDDDPLVRDVLAGHVAALGFEVASAENGISGLAWARRSPPDLVLLDLEMPGMDGREVLARLRRDPSTAEVPVIVVTGVGDPAIAAECIEGGADDFVQKPPNGVILRARIRACVERRRLRLQDREAQRRLEEYCLGLERALREAGARRTPPPGPPPGGPPR